MYFLIAEGDRALFKIVSVATSMSLLLTVMTCTCCQQGIPPASLARVSSSSLREFITLCINPVPENRPSALQLLKHEFFDFLRTGKPQHMVGLLSGFRH